MSGTGLTRPMASPVTWDGQPSSELARLVNAPRHAVSVTVWQPTEPMPAVTPEPPASRPPCLCEMCRWAMDVAGGYDGPCRCDACKYGRRPGAGVVLYDREDGEWMRIQAGLRDGWLEDYAAHHIAAARDIDARFDMAEERSLRRFETIARRVDAARRAAAA